jgi:hypothetical protein
MPRLGQTAGSPRPAHAGTLEMVRGESEELQGVQGGVPCPLEACLYLGVMAFLVLAVGMAVAGSSGQGCLG